ncbi:MAG TPA: MBL fold metallo-hydrolase [Candidatus Acidoferrum sp.]|jgi:competence protein ComEC|nr:MBL fold metallo-hydrolase [Candidatus Acidoferrum sp.]
MKFSKLRFASLAAGVAILFAAPLIGQQTKALAIYFIDVEGGQSTLFVTPSGQSVLVDTGWPGERDADRIVSTAKQAGISQIDDLLITHYHTDHAGGAPTLATKIPIRNFFDHGDTVEHDAAGQKLYDDYQKVAARGHHVVVTPGYKLPVKDVDWTIVTAAGKSLEHPLPGAGQPNPGCADFQKEDVDNGENAQSDGSIVQFGELRIADLGDLTWNKESELMCPVNKVGTVDIFVVSHHGLDISNSPALVHALHPRVAIMDNGATKGGTAKVWTTVHTSPGIEDLWQLHVTAAAGPDHKSPDDVIANLTDSPDQAYGIKVTAHADGHFEVTNLRNNFTKKY